VPKRSRTAGFYLTLIGRSNDSPTLIEDRRARNVARAENIPYITIQVFPLYGLLERKFSASLCDELLVRLGHAMHTDLAVVEAFRAAAREIDRSRRSEIRFLPVSWMHCPVRTSDFPLLEEGEAQRPLQFFWTDGSSFLPVEYNGNAVVYD
jgi:hypothetical protein